MKKSIYIYIYLSIYLSFSLNGHILNRQEIGKGTSIERNTIFNLEELKVRWKKAALENCPGVPYMMAMCITQFLLALSVGRRQI